MSGKFSRSRIPPHVFLSRLGSPLSPPSPHFLSLLFACIRFIAPSWNAEGTLALVPSPQAVCAFFSNLFLRYSTSFTVASNWPSRQEPVPRTLSSPLSDILCRYAALTSIDSCEYLSLFLLSLPLSLSFF